MAVSWKSRLRWPAILAAAWIIVFFAQAVFPLSELLSHSMVVSTILFIPSALLLTIYFIFWTFEPRLASFWPAMAIVAVAILPVSFHIRMHVLARAVQRAGPLIQQIEAFAQRHDRPPKDLAELGPGIETLLETGIPACPEFTYERGVMEGGSSSYPGTGGPRPWTVKMSCHLTLPDVQAYYGDFLPGETCAEHIKCVGNWVLRVP